MKCIYDEAIQKYIDGETTARKTADIEKHLETCSFCAQKIENQRIFTKLLKEEIRSWGTVPHAIPEYKAPSLSKRRFVVKNKYYMYAASAAAVIAFLVIFLLLKENKTNEYQMIYCLDGDFDSNRPYSQQEMSIKIMDKNGNIIECN